MNALTLPMDCSSGFLSEKSTASSIVVPRESAKTAASSVRFYKPSIPYRDAFIGAYQNVWAEIEHYNSLKASPNDAKINAVKKEAPLNHKNLMVNSFLAWAELATAPEAHIYVDIINFMTSRQYTYSISHIVAISSIALASKLLRITPRIEYYPSLDDTVTFELFFDNGQATIIHGQETTLVMSSDKDVKASDYGSGEDDIIALLDEIKSFYNN